MDSIISQTQNFYQWLEKQFYKKKEQICRFSVKWLRFFFEMCSSNGLFKFYTFERITENWIDAAKLNLNCI